MLQTIKWHAVSLLFGIIIGVVASMILLNPRQPIDSQIKITQLSGERITHHDVRVEDGAIRFRTTADGKGESSTEIPNRIVPEARKWMDNVHCIQPILGYEYGPRGGYPIYGFMYLQRLDCLAAGGGAFGSGDSFGVIFAVQCWF